MRVGLGSSLVTLENGRALVMTRGAQRLGGARRVPGLFRWDWQDSTWHGQDGTLTDRRAQSEEGGGGNQGSPRRPRGASGSGEQRRCGGAAEGG